MVAGKKTANKAVKKHCAAKTKAGKKCKRLVSGKSKYCAAHAK